MEEIFLVKKAKKGDTQAFAQLYEKVYVKLYRFARYTLKNEQDAEDVVSETVMEAFEAIGKLKKEESFESWILRILSNKCKRKMREYYQKKVTYSEEQLDLTEETQVQGERILENLEVQRAFMKLDDEERMILGMHVFFGYKTREIAQMLQMNENTVRSKESRAIQKMRISLKG